MISEQQVKTILLNDLHFNAEKVNKLDKFVSTLLDFNSRRNLIGKSTEKHIWDRHVLDSAQLINFIEPSKCNSLADLGTGGGFPGIVLAIFFSDFNFHVKMYEKSPVKSAFLKEIVAKLDLKAKVYQEDVSTQRIDSNYIVCRAFRKLNYILKISRENCGKKHKIIILSGKTRENDIKKALMSDKYRYRMEKSITKQESKIVIIEKI